MASVKVRLIPGAAAKIKRQLEPAIARNMVHRGLNVETAAKRRISMSPRRIDTGRLRSSIRTVPMGRGGASGVRVGSNVEYAFYVHEGTRYMIANPYLRDALPAARL